MLMTLAAWNGMQLSFAAHLLVVEQSQEEEQQLWNGQMKLTDHSAYLSLNKISNNSMFTCLLNNDTEPKV